MNKTADTCCICGKELNLAAPHAYDRDKEGPCCRALARGKMNNWDDVPSTEIVDKLANIVHDKVA